MAALVGCNDLFAPRAPGARPEVGHLPEPLSGDAAWQKAPTTAGIYVVTSDDRTFYDIAKKVYGDGDRWRLIAQANPEVNQARMLPGQQLIIPPLPPPPKTE